MLIWHSKPRLNTLALKDWKDTGRVSGLEDRLWVPLMMFLGCRSLGLEVILNFIFEATPIVPLGHEAHFGAVSMH